MQVELRFEFIRCSTLTISSDFLNLVKERQLADTSLVGVRELLGIHEAKEFALGSDGVQRFQGRVCVPDNFEVKRLILEEGYKSLLSLHPGMTKIVSRSQGDLLMARYEEGCSSVCISLFDMSKGKGRAS